jgi:N-acetylglucosamine-6-phosphate deacetylase
MIAGVHVEGPFLSPLDGYRGAHPADAICEASVEATEQLLEAGQGEVKMFTLAPEMDPDARVARLLASRGIAVAAGHSDASLEQLERASDAGLSLFTHLGNGCPMRGMHRHDSIVQRVLWLARRGRITPTFIADGVHVPFVALENYLHAVGMDRAIIVSDAMAAAGLGAGRYQLGRWNVEVGEDLAAWAPDRSHLVGSAMSMKRAAENLSRIGLGAKTGALLASNARAVLGVSA